METPPSAGTGKHNPLYLGKWTPSIPSMLENSPALTATMSVCLDACAKKDLNRGQRRSVDAHLYGKALSEVQKAVQRSSDQSSFTSTLLAVMLLQKLETVLSTRRLAVIPCWSVHAGGISQLLQNRCAPDPEDDILFNAVLEHIGPIISHAVFKKEDGFLTRPEWQRIFSERKAANKVESMSHVVHSQLACLPKLINGFHALRSGKDTFSRTMDVGLEISAKLSTIGQTLDHCILPRMQTVDVSSDSTAPIKRFFLVSDLETARLICWHADVTILANAVLSQIAEIEGNEKAAASLQRQNVLMSRRIWMMSHEARRAGILQYYFYPGALTVTWESAESDSERRWIVELLNEMQGCDAVSEDAWTAESVQQASDVLTGKG